MRSDEAPGQPADTGNTNTTDNANATNYPATDMSYPATTTDIALAAQLRPPPRRRRRGVIGAVVVLALIVGLCVSTGHWPGLRRQVSSSPSAASTSASPTFKPTPTTAVGDRTQDRANVLRAAIVTILDGQALALLNHDEAGFLRSATARAAREALSLRYRNLIAMHVARIQYAADNPTPDKPSGRWRLDVLVSFCFVVESCDMDTVTESMTWADTASGAQLLAVSPVDTGREERLGHTQPWQTTKLSVAVGSRVVVATTAPLAYRLPAVLAAAEKGIATAEKFAIGTKPDAYRVYLAGPAEWRKWYGGQTTAWAAGYTTGTGASHSDVVLNSAHVLSSDLGAILRHELTHVTTAYGGISWRGNFWLIEGIAAYAEHPSGLSVADWRDQALSYIRHGWKHNLPGDWPADKASPELAGDMYGVAFFAIKRLDQRYGRAKLLDFFDRVVRQYASLEFGSTGAFGVEWSVVRADLVKYISSAGSN